MLANLVCSLIKHKRVTTTLAKAKAARSVAEKMVTLGKSGTIHHRRLAVAVRVLVLILALILVLLRAPCLDRGLLVLLRDVARAQADGLPE